MSKAGRSLVAGLSEDAADAMMAKYETTGRRLDAAYFTPKDKAPRKKASSINYWICGNLVPVFGSHDANKTTYKHDGWLTQHHGPTYRTLIEQQLR